MKKINLYYAEKYKEIIELYKSGVTQRKIGDLYDLSPQRVQQIISNMGVSKSEGGCFIAKEKRKKERIEARNKIYQKTYGCDIDFAINISSKLRHKFRRQRNNAIRRGIGFELSLPQWITAWDESGVLELRGRQGYVMARKGDVGSYAVGNIYICTSSQNIKDGFANKPFSTRKKNKDKATAIAKKGWSYNPASAPNRRYFVRVNGITIGRYATAEIARQKYIEAKSIGIAKHYPDAIAAPKGNNHEN